MIRFPEPVEIIRNIDPRYRPGIGFVFAVDVRLNDGRMIRYYEAKRDGALTVCESREEAFEVLRQKGRKHHA